MVLGIITGSMPMLVSLLLMQGITLTMWRSFLDRAIPSYNSERWFNNINKVIHGNSGTTQNAISSSIPSIQTTDLQSTIPINNNNNIPNSNNNLQMTSTFDQPQTDPVVNSLQILSKLDPTMIDLLSKLQPNTEVKPETTTTPSNELNTLTNLLQSLSQVSGGIQSIPGSSLYNQLNQLKYDQSYSTNDDNKYQFINDNEKATKKKQKILSEELYEEVDYGDPDETGDSNENDEEYEYEDTEEMDPKKQKGLREKILSESRNKLKYLKMKNQKIKKIFGKPRIAKRMLKFEKNSFESQWKQKFLNSFLSFPFLKRNSKKKSYSSWKRTTTNKTKNGNNLITSTQSTTIILTNESSPIDSNQIYSKLKKSPSKMNINRSKKSLKQITKPFTLAEIDEIVNECKNNVKSKKNFNELWSQKNGWNRCHPKSPNFRISKGIKVPNVVNNHFDPTISSTTLIPQTETNFLTTTMPIFDNSENTFAKSIKAEQTELPPINSTTSNSISDTMLLNFNEILMNFSLPTTTTTTMPLINNMEQNLSKEFLFHILNAINSTKIDNYQINNASTKSDEQNDKEESEHPILKSSSHDNEKHEEDSDDDNEPINNNNNLDDIHQINEDNRIDGKILVAHRFKRVCYYLLNSGKHLDISQLELHICSHLIVGYARISPTGLVVTERPLEDTEKYRRSTMIKLHYPRLKVLLSIGDLGGAMFSIVSSSNHTRESFIMSVLDICDEFNFDGVDIDWEFPGLRTPGSLRDKKNFILLLKELRIKSKKFWKHRIKSGNRFIISVAVGAPMMIASTSYIIPDIGKFVDFVNLMSYDFHYYRPDRPYTGHHSPLYPRSTDNGYFSTLNVAWTATYWANSGMPLRKIIVGVPTYARTYNLVVPIGQNMINVPARGPGIGKGKLNYTQVCEFLKLPETSKQYDYYSQVPYAYRGFDWISYENERSVAIKAQWVVKTGMGGIVTFALNFDDTKGTCREDGKRFPLQKTISNVLELASIKSYRKSLYLINVNN